MTLESGPAGVGDDWVDENDSGGDIGGDNDDVLELSTNDVSSPGGGEGNCSSNFSSSSSSSDTRKEGRKTTTARTASQAKRRKRSANGGGSAAGAAVRSKKRLKCLAQPNESLGRRAVKQRDREERQRQVGVNAKW